MNTKRWLVVLFIVTLAIRLALAFSIPNLTYESYFHVRQVEHITEHGLPLFDDPLSYGGRTLQFLPLFHYVAAGFNLFFDIDTVTKVLPNVLISLLVLIVYKMTHTITKNNKASLFSAFIAGFLPVLFETNSFTPTSLFLPFLFITIYFFMRIKERKYVQYYVMFFLLISFTSSATLLLVIGFVFYLLLLLIEGKQPHNDEVELIIFSILFFIWTQFIFFKNTFLTEGLGFIWKNVPPQIIFEYFPQISIAKALVLVSVIPFVAGIFVVYKSLFHLRKQKTFLLISLVVSTTLLAWLQIMEFELSLAFFGVSLAILFGTFYKEAVKFGRKTRIPRIQSAIPIIIFVALLLTTTLPAVTAGLTQETPTDEQIELFKWIKESLPEEVRVITTLEEGHLLTYYGQRQSFLDEQFGLVPDVAERFRAVRLLYTTQFETQAIGLFNEHNLEYIVFSPFAQEKYQIKDIPYKSTKCFDKVYRKDVKMFQIQCTIGTEESNV